MASDSEPSVPVTFPRSQGLEHVARQAVQDEFDRRGGGGTGTVDLERRVGNLEEFEMVWILRSAGTARLPTVIVSRSV